MLVLTRKQNEKIRIGSSIVITVVRMKGKAVRLGIEAPKDMGILRGELAFDTPAVDAQARDAKVKAVVGEPSEEQLSRGKAAQSGMTDSRRNSTWPAERAMTSPMSASDFTATFR